MNNKQSGKKNKALFLNSDDQLDGIVNHQKGNGNVCINIIIIDHPKNLDNFIEKFLNESNKNNNASFD